MYVIDVTPGKNGAGKSNTASNTIGGLLGGLGGKLGHMGGLIGGIGHIFGFAEGGDPPLNVPSLVGERGPELFVPRQSGTVVPNKALGGSGGHQFNIDARGSHNPAQTVALIDAYMQHAAPKIVAASTKAVHDHAARRPKV